MTFTITHGARKAVVTFPRRSAASALRAVHDLEVDGATDIKVKDSAGRTLTLQELREAVESCLHDA